MLSLKQGNIIWWLIITSCLQPYWHQTSNRIKFHVIQAQGLCQLSIPHNFSDTAINLCPIFTHIDPYNAQYLISLILLHITHIASYHQSPWISSLQCFSGLHKHSTWLLQLNGLTAVSSLVSTGYADTFIDLFHMCLLFHTKDNHAWIL